MTKALTVARWEYLEKIKSKAFLISLILMPIIMIGMGVIPSLLATRPDTESRIVGIVDQTGELAQSVSERLSERYKLPNGKPNYVVRVLASGRNIDAGQQTKAADQMVTGKEIEGYAILRGTAFHDSTVEYRSQNVANFSLMERFTRVITEVITEKKLREQGFDPQLVRRLTVPIELKTTRLKEGGETEEADFGKVFFGAFIFMMMMFFLVATSGQLLVRSLLEEKSNRVAEVLMSSCSANELMVGKILGLSGVGFTQIAFWGVIGLAISLQFAINLISLSNALLLLVYFVFGYLLYAAIFVGAGAPLTTEQEAQQITNYLVLILVMPIALAFPVIQNPDSALAKVLTFIPIITPTMMALRIPIQTPSVLEIILSLALLAGSAAAAMWVAGKIFRIGMLTYGKRPSLTELVRWVRTA
jgi:ABC-2 type transport system permease protein